MGQGRATVAGAGPRSRPADYLGAAFALVLFAAPKISLKIFGAPIYLLDLLAVLLCLQVTLGKAPGQRRPMVPLERVSLLYLGCVALGEARGFFEFGQPVFSAYSLGRSVLAISTVYSIGRLGQHPRRLRYFIASLALAVIITSALVALSSFPGTRSLVSSTVFKWKLLDPSNSAPLDDFYAELTADSAVRGRSLIGISTFTTGVLGTAWPLACLGVLAGGPHTRLRILARVAAVAAPIGLLLTYGRAAWGTVIILGLLLAYKGIGIRRQHLIALTLLVAGVVLQAGSDSRFFKLDRIVLKTEVMIETSGESDAPRLYSYLEPFAHVMEHPEWLFVGIGQTLGQLLKRGLLRKQDFRATLDNIHSGFGMSYYYTGAIGTFCQIALLGLGLGTTLMLHQHHTGPFSQIFWLLFLSWIGLLFWWLVGHAPVSAPRGVYVYFTLTGLTVAAQKVSSGPSASLNPGLR